MKRVQVVLLKPVSKLGLEGEVKTVASGYAKNFLLPEKLAILASEHEVEKARNRRALQQQQSKQKEEVVGQRMRSLQRAVVILSAPANDKGGLYGSIKAEEICHMLQKMGFGWVTPSMVEMKSPIHHKGTHTVNVHIQNKKTQLTITVEAAKRDKVS